MPAPCVVPAAGGWCWCEAAAPGASRGCGMGAALRPCPTALGRLGSSPALSDAKLHVLLQCLQNLNVLMSLIVTTNHQAGLNNVWIKTNGLDTLPVGQLSFFRGILLYYRNRVFSWYNYTIPQGTGHLLNKNSYEVDAITLFCISKMRIESGLMFISFYQAG